MVLRAVLAATALLAASCYASHEVEGDLPPPASDLPEGVVYDHPDGLFREVVLTDDPLPCEAVRYSAPDATGSVTDRSVPRWLSLVRWQDGTRRYMFHDGRSNIGPGPATFSIPPRFDPGMAEPGERITVTWAVDVVTRGSLSGTSLPVYCGVLTVR